MHRFIRRHIRGIAPLMVACLLLMIVARRFSSLDSVESEKTTTHATVVRVKQQELHPRLPPARVRNATVKVAIARHPVHAPIKNYKKPDPTNRVTDFWQPVNGTQFKTRLFSAYYDTRGQRRVTVVGVASFRHRPVLYCVLWYNDTVTAGVRATSVLIMEHWNMNYTAIYFDCNLRARDPVPNAVSLVSHADDTSPSNYARVHKHADTPAPRNGRFSVCIKPLHYNYGDTLRLAEFVEFHRTMGAEFFTFYNHSVNADVTALLQYYVERGVAEVLPWQLDIKSQREIRTENMFAALNDCLLRNQRRYEYQVVVDVDEFIVPHLADDADYTQLLRRLTAVREDAYYVGAYCFRNTFFYSEWPDDAAAATLPLHLTTLAKTKRTQKTWPRGNRSKCIVRGADVTIMGNHLPWRFADGRQFSIVEEGVALLHHYRVCEYDGHDCVKTAPAVVDATVYRWKDELLRRVATVLAAVTSSGS
ncbi:PREDICTED: uncharacterized protein LOC106821346 [Priapulus caudatus]|uniref:Glycosyltransferase family 92 protein n=1 Tax=Priapulus caudatus TaxID=37621 RepID=A0ABM1FAX2_PRICU|nr:PREDICTED: uncharacterized protein LOC106821346 [Priapulus caudatus]XP_014681594.1 PREDICTED: uncharacterized protein LOC106821346 [Priapulus caudatus]